MVRADEYFFRTNIETKSRQENIEEMSDNLLASFDR